MTRFGDAVNVMARFLSHSRGYHFDRRQPTNEYARGIVRQKTEGRKKHTIE